MFLKVDVFSQYCIEKKFYLAHISQRLATNNSSNVTNKETLLAMKGFKDFELYSYICQ